MRNDPLVEEARQAGQRYIDSFKGDRKALIADMKRRALEEGRKLVPPPPRVSPTIIKAHLNNLNVPPVVPNTCYRLSAGSVVFLCSANWIAALMKPRNIGWGRRGRLVSSGCACVPRK